MNAVDVANFFVTVGTTDKGLEMTNARVNKLLYFAQGWSLSIYNKKLFDEPILAWDYGPVVRSVYNAFKPCGDNIIVEPSGEFSMDKISQQDRDLLLDVFTEYMNVSTFGLDSLVARTHKSDTPYSKVYVRGGNNVIPTKKIKEYFDKQPKLHRLSDSIAEMPTVGYIDNEGYTVLPQEYYYEEDDDIY